jgi:hypothetical protein
MSEALHNFFYMLHHSHIVGYWLFDEDPSVFLLFFSKGRLNAW